MAALALPTESELTQLSKNDLISVVQRSVSKLQNQGAKLRKMAAALKDPMKTGALELADYGSAALGGGGVGFWMGSIQRKILDGEEGYDEESLVVLGVDKDLAAAIAGAVGAFAMARAKNDKLRKASVYFKNGAMGALAAWAGRTAYEYAMTPPEEEGAQPVA